MSKKKIRVDFSGAASLVEKRSQYQEDSLKADKAVRRVEKSILSFESKKILAGLDEVSKKFLSHQLRITNTTLINDLTWDLIMKPGQGKDVGTNVFVKDLRTAGITPRNFHSFFKRLNNHLPENLKVGYETYDDIKYLSKGINPNDNTENAHGLKIWFVLKEST